MITETDPRFADIVFFIEANDFERSQLWLQYNKDVQWKPDSGLICTIGHINQRPICVSVTFDILNGKRVMFYYGCSQLVDHEMIDEWLDHNVKAKWDNMTRRAHCDAMNFHHCLQAIGI